MNKEIVLSGFRQRNTPLSADYRPMYKIGILVCILKLACISNKASLNKLHFLSWAIKLERNRSFVLKIIAENDFDKLISWGIEPALNKAIGLAVGEGLLSLDKDRYLLTDKGDSFYKKINANKDLYSVEKEFLKNIGKRSINETFMNELTLKLNN